MCFSVYLVCRYICILIDVINTDGLQKKYTQLNALVKKLRSVLMSLIVKHHHRKKEMTGLEDGNSYWGYRSYFLLHYTDDHTVYKAFPHRSLKQVSRPFIRSAPFVKEKVATSYKTAYLHL